MAASDPCLARIEAFNKSKGGGVTVTRVRGGYNLYLTATQAPIAGLQPKGPDDRMSDCVVFQVASHGFRSLSIALRIVRSFRMSAVRAIFLGFPASVRR